MKIFWGVILVLALAAGVLLARGGSGRPAAEPVAATGALLSGPAVDAAPDGDVGSPAQLAPAVATTETAETGVAPAEGAPADQAPAEDVPAGEVPQGETNAPAEEHEPGGAAETPPESEFDEPAVAPTAIATAPVDHDAVAQEQARQVAEQAAAAREAAAAAPDAPTGPSIRINDKWTVPGEGTAANPYVVPWDVLVSAGREYNPREGKTELPDWATQLDGKRVRLTGFLLFPIVATDADELLVMYNQWDGCCIGIPPTPYDSVEVKLAEPAGKDAWRFNYGAVTGTLRVDPYLAGKWLVSLYVVEDAGLEAGGL